jgi:hypothetical protein
MIVADSGLLSQDIIENNRHHVPPATIRHLYGNMNRFRLKAPAQSTGMMSKGRLVSKVIYIDTRYRTGLCNKSSELLSDIKTMLLLKSPNATATSPCYTVLQHLWQQWFLKV